ncbi:hypothetical protein Bca52824_092313 [Brassica carinata]|uniref:Glycoside hydrolase family 5 domain-containing protein n=2 Tax=Brassica TaxID=3705 RepID=A0A8X7NU78_BRACI|nr:hypothetical protein Bca52824_092313 [Brassica carinata]
MFRIFTFTCFFSSYIAQHTVPNIAYPLSTSSRWIVDENGQRVKLACVNWPSHFQPVVAEGLSKQPVDAVAKKIVEMGFNCVRLTWPLDLMTNETLANNVTMVVTTLGNNDVMVILDNHLTKPGWCCANDDGNGFFGDQFFDPTVWTAALRKMAATFDGVFNVVGMSLRNELRGPKQNVNDWFKYMQQGAEAVHSANKNVLVILSGLNFDADLSFVRSRPVNLSFTRKLVFELHWYAFSDGNLWATSNPNDICGRVLKRLGNRGNFLLNKGLPLFLSEFGIDQRGGNANDNRYLGCLSGWAAENDVDWSLWALTGSYYLREGVVGMIEYYGALDSDWNSVRNSSFLQQISLLQSPLQGPGPKTDAFNLVFHPLTGLCLVRSLNDKTMLTLEQRTEKQGHDDSDKLFKSRFHMEDYVHL